MKAVVYHKYGSPDNLELQEIETPAPGNDQVLVRVHAASVNALDWHFLTGKPFLARVMNGGLLRPRQRILGVDLAGRVETAGAGVTRFRPGDEVFGGCGNGGAFAEYACAAKAGLQPKPPNLIFDVAAKLSFSDCRRVLNPGGIYVTTEFSPALLLKGLWVSMTGDRKLVSQLAKPPSAGDWALMRELLETSQVKTAIDRSYTLGEVPEALRYLGQGHARGKVIISINEGLEVLGGLR